MPLNMLPLAKSRKKPQPGDIFVFQLRQDRLFRYGRVIRASVELVAMDGSPSGMTAILVYIYKASSARERPVPRLRKDELIVPPLLINDTGWRDGYFETVEQGLLAEDDVLHIHCFHSPGHVGYRYVDIDGKPLPGRCEPCGFYALGGYGSVDLKVSRALGFPEPTEDPLQSRAGSASSVSSTKKRRRRAMKHRVTLYLPGAEKAPALEDVEEAIIEAIATAGAGEWDGHEIDLDSSDATIYLYGRDADRLAEVVVQVVRTLGFPKGACLAKRYGEPGDPEERVEL
jgi:hypothetical protein